jgi:hypothetical protein
LILVMAVKTVYFFKGRPLKSRVLRNIWEEIEQTKLLINKLRKTYFCHWCTMIVQGRILYRVYELNPIDTVSQNQSHIATDRQSVCLSWCRTPSGACLVLGRAPSLTRGRVCRLSVSQ